jgi:GT2 family glycosyltransferase
VVRSSAASDVYKRQDLDLTKTQTVEQPAGALFLFRRDDWEELGGFDERYFPVWFEDVDFARRFRDSGGTIVLEPSVLALHVGGHSVQKLTDASRIRFWYGSLLRYVVQHFGAVPRRLVAGCVLFGLAARCILGIFLLRGWPALGAHLDCIRLSARCVVLGKIKNH